MRIPGFASLGGLMLLTALLAYSAFAQPSRSSDDKELQKLHDDAEDFLAGLAIDPEKAYQALLARGPLADHAEKLLPKTLELKKYGAFPGADGIELVREQRIGQDVVLLKYLQKFDRLPVVWHFSFYRPDGESGFSLVTVRFDTELELLGLALGEQ